MRHSLFWNPLWAIAFGLSFSLPTQAAPKIEGSVHKDASTGWVIGNAKGTLVQSMERLWPVLADAIHGQLNANTTVCVSLSESDVRSRLGGLPAERLPLPDAQEAAAFESFRKVGSKTPAIARIGEKSTRYVLRKMDIPVPFVGDRWVLAKETLDATDASKFTLKIEGLAGNVRHYDTTWTLTPSSLGTFVEVRVSSDLNFQVPSSLAGLGSSELRGSLRRFSEIADTKLSQ